MFASALVAFALTLAIDLHNGEVDGFGALLPALQGVLGAAAVMTGVVAVSRSRAEGSPGYLWLGFGIGGFGLIHVWVWVAAGLGALGLLAPLSAAQLRWDGVTGKLLVAGLLVLSAWNPIPRFSPTAARVAAGAAVLVLIALSGAAGHLPIMAFFVLDAGVAALAMTAMAGVLGGVEWRGRPLKPYLGLALGALIVNQVSPVNSIPLPGTSIVSVEDLTAIVLVGAMVVGGMEDLRHTFFELRAARSSLELAYSQLVLKAAEAERSSLARRTFLGMVSHELLTPLNAVLGYSHLLRAGLAGSPKQLRHVANIEAGGRRLQALVDDILALTAARSGEIVASTSALDVAGLLKRAADEAAPMARAKGISVEHSTEPGQIIGDSRMLSLTIRRLLDNAIKFTREGGSVVIGGRSLGSRYEISLSDDGPGIAPQDGQRIFEPFEQVDEGPARRFDGLGLGLPIVRELVSAMGGEVSVTSRLGGGATFTITLSLAGDRTPEFIVPASEPPEVATILP